MILVHFELELPIVAERDRAAAGRLDEVSGRLVAGSLDAKLDERIDETGEEDRARLAANCSLAACSPVGRTAFCLCDRSPSGFVVPALLVAARLSAGWLTS